MKKTIILEAHVNCPRCKHGFTVRNVERGNVSPDEARKIASAVDEMFSAMDKAFKKIFG